MKLSNEKSSDSQGQPINPSPIAEKPEVVGNEQKKATVGRPTGSLNKKKLILWLAVCLAIAAVAAILLVRQLNKTKQKASGNRVATQADAVNASLQKGNKDEALEHAKKALSQAPNDPEALLAVANLSKEKHPDEAKQYYIEAFDLYKTQNNPDKDGQSALVYWAAAGLAENAGNTYKARQYYVQVIAAANKSNSYEKNLAEQSQAALKRLK